MALTEELHTTPAINDLLYGPPMQENRLLARRTRMVAGNSILVVGHKGNVSINEDQKRTWQT